MALYYIIIAIKYAIWMYFFFVFENLSYRQTCAPQKHHFKLKYRTQVRQSNKISSLSMSHRLSIESSATKQYYKKSLWAASSNIMSLTSRLVSCEPTTPKSHSKGITDEPWQKVLQTLGNLYSLIKGLNLNS